MRPWYDDNAPWCDEAEENLRLCAQPECRLAGEHRAPKSPHKLNDYHWFCLDHVRTYNAQWNFAKGMDPEQIETLIRFDAAWQRETRPLGDWRTKERLLRAKVDAVYRNKPYRAPPPQAVPPQVTDALERMELALPLTEQALRVQYRALVKLHHPDANGGCGEAEERLKDINLAYAVLRDFVRKA